MSKRTYGSKSAKIRASNEQVARQAEQHRLVSRVPLVCECDDPDCNTIVSLRLSEYHDLRSDPSYFLTSPGHTLSNARPTHMTKRYWIHRLQPT
jgi:hypothetical protein